MTTNGKSEKCRIAFETISFGQRFADRSAFKNALRLIKDLGYRGVEIAQRPDYLGGGDASELRDLLAEHEL